jgi:magnesium chelatase family protein
MVTHIRSYALQGLDALPIDVQLQISQGLPAFTIVGLPDKAVGESRERVRAALTSLGLSLPPKRITINLSPANIQKEGSHFDLPIAVGMLVALGAIPVEETTELAVMGELTLDGKILPVPGVLPAAVAAMGEGLGLVCPAANGQEARWAGDMRIIAAGDLTSLINHFKGTQTIAPPALPRTAPPSTARDLRHVRGQEAARRALEIAASGRHNLLMSGPPGVGKSMLASCMPGIMPPMESRDILELSMIASIAGLLVNGELSEARPYRAPHHSSSMAAIIGGGRKAVPGEISLAHGGVLFLDELPEFAPQVLESLRQPLENKNVSIARVQAHVSYPANFQLIAAMNPCKCGYLGVAGKACSVAPRCGEQYTAKLSGPLLDRIDVHVEMAAQDTLDMLKTPEGESTATVAQRVARTWEIQRMRYKDMPATRSNADLNDDALKQFANPTDAAMALLQQSIARLGLSMRAYTRMLRVARTIADMEASHHIEAHHMAEALGYRKL